MAQSTYKIPDAVKNDTYIGITFNVEVNSVLLDLTGCSIKMDVKKNSKDYTPPLKTFRTGASSPDGSLTITDAVNGQFELDEQVIDIEAGNHYYDIQITFPDSSIKTYICGRWQIIQDITANDAP